MEKHFKRLRNKLPRNYVVRITAEVTDVTARQVRAVFSGEITNPAIVEKVLDGALKVQRITQMRDKRLYQKLQASKRLARKKMAA